MDIFYILCILSLSLPDDEVWFNKIAEEQKTDQATNGQEELEESTPIKDDPEPTIVITFLYIFYSYTLVRLIMTGYIVAGKNNGGYKYGRIAEKPPKVCLSV